MYHFKRPREDEDAEMDMSPSSSKRIRTLPSASATLPFRDSPTSQHSTAFSSTRLIPKPPALTPAESSDEDSEIEFHSPEYPPKANIPTFFSTDADMDYDMGDAQPFGSPMFSPKTPGHALLGSSGLPSPGYTQLLTVASPHNLSANANARIPTPIYGHFSNLQRTTIANANSPTAANPPPAGVVRTTNEQHDAFLRRRRLPSPICEDAPVESPTTLTMLQDLDMSASPASAAFPSHTADFPVHTDEIPQSKPSPDFSTPFSPTFGRRKSSGADSGDSNRSSVSSGRRRSDAVSGGERQKFVFSMGFRADCEKCREHVPGHYSHVLKV